MVSQPRFPATQTQETPVQVSYKKTLFYVFLLPAAILLLVWRFSPWTKKVVLQFLYPFERTTVGVNVSPDGDLETKSREELIEVIQDFRPKVEEYDQMSRELDDHRRVNAELRAYLKVPPPPGFKKVAGYILNRDPSRGGRVMRLNIGSRAGIDVGYAVLSGSTIIGRISNVSKDSCTVNTLLDPGCRIPARVKGVKAYGTLFGAGEEGWKRNPFCVLKYLPRDLEYLKGMEVVTSAYSEYLPPNLHIGTVQPRSDGSMVSTVNQLYKNVWIKPTAFDADPGLLTVLVPIKPEIPETVELPPTLPETPTPQ